MWRIAVYNGKTSSTDDEEEVPSSVCIPDTDCYMGQKTYDARRRHTEDDNDDNKSDDNVRQKWHWGNEEEKETEWETDGDQRKHGEEQKK